MSDKGSKIGCTLDKFLELSTNPQTGKLDEKSIFEAKGGLQREASGMYGDLRHPVNLDVDIDFEATDIKTGKQESISLWTIEV
jgi:hypothetical protein